jgi:hypothetical protein
MSLDRESNLRPLAYSNTASIKGTMTLATKPNCVNQFVFLFGYFIVQAASIWPYSHAKKVW